MHTKHVYFITVYFPLEAGDFAVIYFVGGLGGVVPAEGYSIFLSKVAAHGFFVFGVDYVFPAENNGKLGEDVNIYFKELEFVSCSTF